MLAARRLAARIGETLEPDGFNILNSCGAAAWQTVFHFHVHVVPRYEDDPLKLPWVPAEGDTDEIARTPTAIAGRGLMAERTIGLEREGAVAQIVLSTRRSTCSPTTPSTSSWTASTRSRARTRGRSSGAPRARSSPAASTSTPSSASSTRTPGGGERHGRAADRGGAAARGARDPDPGADPRPLPHRGARGRAGLRPDVGRGVVEVRARRGGGRAHARRRRHAADGRSGRARAGARVRDDPRPLRRRGPGALGRHQPGRPGRHGAREGDALRPAARERPDEGPRGDQAHRQGRLRRGVERADEVTPAQFAELFATEDLQNAVRSFLADGPGKATFEGK